MTVDRNLVHRAATSEVLLTDWRQIDEHTFLSAAQWPRGHSLYGTTDEHLDPLFVGETIRQAGILITHVGYGVPRGHKMIMKNLKWTCEPANLRSPEGPLQCEVMIRASKVLQGRGTANGMTLDFLLKRKGQWLAEGTGMVRCLVPKVYERVRWHGEPRVIGPAPVVPPAAPGEVGRLLHRDVVLGPADESGGRDLRVVTKHPVFFDHRLDHVPGMLLFEAMRQAAVATTGGRLSSVVAAEGDFPHFVELDRTCRVVAEPLGRESDPVLVRFVQDGRVVAHGSIMLCASPTGE
ncbi:ScbA/BarX family gamma-butyrolactone biosynthesis protein [Salinispora fenicalii]|uniref:ScbA/BarX family gamma-butyrolactone biosynthesis protein n=1 Tax=Salinispora fenicalii TaxID=1137263 RepID=UPI000366E94A|nr:ScbA/BarX family gamma-butyrolactone biosynthesis protein [Salinispora fenicalii]